MNDQKEVGKDLVYPLLMDIIGFLMNRNPDADSPEAILLKGLSVAIYDYEKKMGWEDGN